MACAAMGILLRKSMLDRYLVRDIGIDSARHYAAIRLELKAAGKTIPANEIGIAILSRQYMQYP